MVENDLDEDRCLPRVDLSEPYDTRAHSEMSEYS